MRLGLSKSKVSALAAFLAATALGCTRQPESAILYIGDGMGVAQVTAARIYQANARDGRLTLDTLEHVALVRTYAADRMVTDSAAAATALATGFKANAGAIAMDADGKRLETVLEKAKKAGKSVGIVTTTTVTHATPACFYAHAPGRYDEAALAAQLIDYGEVDLVLGGGRAFFLPRDGEDGNPSGGGSRSDQRNLLEEAEAKGYRVLKTRGELKEIFAELEAGKPPGKLLGLFSSGMMAYEAGREANAPDQPSILEMTSLAIEILSRNPRGFFLMVEGGRIDHASHANRALLTVIELLAFDEALQAGIEATRAQSRTLIVVTADHETGGMSINGYPPIDIGGDALFSTPNPVGGNDIVTFATGPGANRETANGAGGVNRAKDDPNYRQPALFQAGSAAHTGTDVLLWATGPGAELFGGTMDNSEVGAKIIEALGLD